jgi:hypothetical protein
MTTYAGGGRPIANVFIGTVQAKRMMLGDKIIWMPPAPAGTPMVGGSPELTTEFKTPGTFSYAIPMWANKIDVVVIGGGQGGINGSPVSTGKGGNAGAWAHDTLTLETIPATTLTLAVTVGKGGPSYNLIGGTGGLGTVSTVTGVGLHATTAPVPIAGNLFDMIGKSPGNHTYNGKTYTGGGTAPAKATGKSPGGGGGGGEGFFRASSGGKGGDGAVFIRAYVKF